MVAPAKPGSELRILVARPDRIGDVILSTPVIEVLKRHYPQAHITVLVREAVAPLIRGLPGVSDVMVFDPDGKHRGIGGLFELIRQFRERRFGIAIVLQSHWMIAAALYAARARYRVGPLSKIHSFLFYNRGIRQRRSQVEMHESDYNLQLLRRLGIRIGTRHVPTQVNVSEEGRRFALAWLKEQGWSPSTKEDPIVVIHPGMGGSALNWPENHYVELVRALAQEGRRVLVTAGPTEGAVLDRVRMALGELAGKVRFYGGSGTGPIDRLAGILNETAVVAAPSTGPLHLAVALGKPVVTFYPPIRVQSAIRWGPYISDESKASINVPDVYCGQESECRGTLCNYYPCMKSMGVNQALGQIRGFLAE